MATLLSPRDDLLLDQSFSGHAIEVAFDWTEMDNPNSPVDQTYVARVRGTAHLSASSDGSAPAPAAGYVRGVSLSAVVQMLHMERKTCVIEVESGDRYGTLTLVNGEVVDAETGGNTGELALYQILIWPEPLTTILEGVSLFRHTVGLPMSQLLIEAVRRQDETTETEQHATAHAEAPAQSNYMSDPITAVSRTTGWTWLAETLIIGGATAAAVVRTMDNRILALTDESGALVRDLRTTRLNGLEHIADASRDWLAQSQTTVDEVVLRVGDQRVLVSPLDAGRTVFVYATLDSDHEFDMIRSAIKTIRR